MTIGSTWHKLAAFSIPLLIGNIVQQMYSTVDAIVVGHYVGDAALAAVGSSFTMINLLLILFMGIATGAGIMVSQYFGAKDRMLLSKTIGSTLTLTVFCSILIMIVGALITRPLLKLLNTPDDVIDMCAEYLIILFTGISGIAFYNLISGILRGMGDSLMPLVFLIVTCALNTVLDLLFVAVFNWGVAGAAWATVIAQLISSVLCLLRLTSMKDVFELKLSHLKPNKELCLSLARLGLPAALTQMIFSLANIVVQSLTNLFGTDVIASSTIIMRVDGFAMMPNFTFGMAMATFVGQNIGAGKTERAAKSSRPGLIMGIGVSAILVGGILIFGRSLMRVFTETQTIIDFSYSMMCILALGYIAMGVTQILSGAMRGAGDTMSPMWVSIISTVIIRTPLAYLLAFMTRSESYPEGRPEVLFISLLISWVLGAVITSVIYSRGKWKSKGLVKADPILEAAVFSHVSEEN
ncbi:MAG: MATE family efflux transporter [Clostridiales bacterium]|nr:MATE family efflux transporter [Clostridiales bacterium]